MLTAATLCLIAAVCAYQYGREIIVMFVVATERGKIVSPIKIKKIDTLASAIEAGDVNKTESLIRTTSDINQLKALDGSNLLAYAVEVNAPVQILSLLISAGIDINATDNHGDTPALWLVKYRGETVDATLDILKRAGANFKIKDKSGDSVNELLNAEGGWTRAQ